MKFQATVIVNFELEATNAEHARYQALNGVSVALRQGLVTHDILVEPKEEAACKEAPSLQLCTS